jgi:hypothetical protein
MFDFLQDLTASGPTIPPRDAFVRLAGALVLGWMVAWVYRAARPASKSGRSFQATLVLLAVLIAIVTQVVGNNAARAFSLVGALSIVRFRTIVQDTQDTAFVIFAVVMGMAAGAGDLWMSVIGLTLVSGAAFAMRTKAAETADLFGYTLSLRVGLGHEVDALVSGPFAAHVIRHRLLSMETVRQGTAVEARYQVQFRPEGSAEAFLKALNRVEGVQNVQLQDAGADDDD